MIPLFSLSNKKRRFTCWYSHPDGRLDYNELDRHLLYWYCEPEPEGRCQIHPAGYARVLYRPYITYRMARDLIGNGDVYPMNVDMMMEEDPQNLTVHGQVTAAYGRREFTSYQSLGIHHLLNNYSQENN